MSKKMSKGLNVTTAFALEVSISSAIKEDKELSFLEMIGNLNHFIKSIAYLDPFNDTLMIKAAALEISKVGCILFQEIERKTIQ